MIVSLQRWVTAVSTIVLLISSSPVATNAGTVETVSQVSTPGVSCELKVKEKYEYYDLEGTTVCDLQKKINEQGTKWNDGRTYAAVTSWDLRYSYDIANDNGKCSVKSVRTDVDIVYHLPRRAPCATVPELNAQWEKYLVNLKQHEFGHKDLTVKVAAQLNETLASLQGFASEEELEREAKRRTDEKLQELKQVQIDYDRETRHGATQGAVLASAE